MLLTDTSQLDPSIVALMHGLKTQESNGNYNQLGDKNSAGEATAAGVGQWSNQVNGKPIALQKGQIPADFQSDAKQFGLDPTDFSPANQNKVMYAVLAKDKADGLGPEQALSKWNSGSPNKYASANSSETGPVGNYNVAKYVSSAMSYAQKYAQKNRGNNGQVTVPQAPKSTQPFTLSAPQTNSSSNSNDPTLGQDLSGRVQDATTGLNSLIGGEANTGQSRFSGALQIAGALGGGIGDVVNKGLELIPGVKALEGVVGKGVGKLAQTPAGQKIVQSLQSFSAAHPELSKDLGAGFNIVTALPILDGIGAIKDVALDGVSQALKSTAEKTVTKDFTATAARTVGGRAALTNGGDSAIKTLVDERALPEIVDGKYSTKEASDKLSAQISHIEDTELQPALKSVSTSGVDTKQPIENLRQEALQKIESEFKTGGNVGKAKSEVNRIFDDYKNSYGDYVSLEDVNDMKRGIRQSVNFNSPKLDSDVSYHVGQTLQKNIETSAEKLGLPDVGVINQKMARLIKAQNMLKYIEQKPIKTGIVTGALKDVATAGGEALGNSTGIPLAGGFIGREAGGALGKKLASIPEAILKRTGKEAVRPVLKNIAKRTTLGAIGALSQKAL